MDPESVRDFCLSLPHAREDVKWGHDLTFTVGEKMFAVLALEPSHDVVLSFKCSPETYAELTEQDGVVPAPYLARYHWVALQRFDALPWRDLQALIRESRQLVWGRLPKRTRMRLEQRHPE